MKWRDLIPGLSEAKDKGGEAPQEIVEELTHLRKLASKLQALNQQQTTQIHYLKEINYRLQEKNNVIVNFIHKGGLHQHEERQDLALTAISRITQDLEPILNSLENEGGLSPEAVKKLRHRSREVEVQILEMREQLKTQRKELLTQLSEKEISLRLQQTDMDSICVQNQNFKEEVRQLRMQISNQKEADKEREELSKHLSKAENELLILRKKYQVLVSAKERFESNQNLAQENALMKKVLSQMDEKLRLTQRQKAALQIEYEKLMEEYERLFSQL